MEEPFTELGPVGSAVVDAPGSSAEGPVVSTADTASDTPTAASAMRDVLSAFAQQQPRDPVSKQFITLLENGSPLGRSRQYWSAVEPAKRRLVDRVRTDLAIDDSSVETLLGLIEGYAEARLFRTTMFLRLIDQGGPITTKGKARALYRAYLDALDRETKLALVLGLERKAKRLDLAQAFSDQERGHD